MALPEAVGYLFPGQGAQFAGMGKDLFDSFAGARRIFNAADGILGYSLSRLCFEGPEEELTRTRMAQPAIYTASLAALAALKENFPGLRPAFAAGLSLGEFTALAACGSISFEGGLALVRARAEAMERCAEKQKGTMASVLGLPQGECEAAAREAGCEVANLNAPDQFVLSGEEAAVEQACRLAEARGAKRALRLRVGGAFHSRLMNEAREAFREALRAAEIREPAAVFIPNAVGRSVRQPEEIRELLARQLTSPVRWIETMRQAAALSLPLFLEIGPGKVLKGLARRSSPGLRVECCGTAEEIRRLEDSYAAQG